MRYWRVEFDSIGKAQGFLNELLRLHKDFTVEHLEYDFIRIKVHATKPIGREWLTSHTTEMQGVARKFGAIRFLDYT